MEKQNPSRSRVNAYARALKEYRMFDRFDIQDVAKKEFDLLIGERLAHCFLIMHKDSIDYAIMEGGHKAAWEWVKNRLEKRGREDFQECFCSWRREQ